MFLGCSDIDAHIPLKRVQNSARALRRLEGDVVEPIYPGMGHTINDDGLVTGRTVGGLRIYPQHNCLDRETALRMWTENVTWFSNEEGKKGHIQVGQLADLIVPDRDYLACAESEIADTTSDLTIVGGKIVYGAGGFAQLDDKGPPPAMPDWSPVRAFGGYAAWADPSAAAKQAVQQRAAASCGCAHACSVHGHGHATAWSSKLPTADLKSFWGALGCSCWAV